MSVQPNIESKSPPDAASSILEEALRKTPQVEGLVLLEPDGRIIEAVGPQEEKLKQIASFAIGVLDLSIRLANESGRGAVHSHLIRTEGGHLAIHRVDEGRLLFTLASEDAPMGLIAHDLNWCAKRIATTTS